jgi:cell division protein FtsB
MAHYRRFAFVAALAAIVLVFAGFTVFGTNGVVRLSRLRASEEALASQAFVLLQRNEDLRQRILRFHRDDYFLETLARSRLGLVREGEIVYRFPPPEHTAVPAPSTP